MIIRTPKEIVLAYLVDKRQYLYDQMKTLEAQAHGIDMAIDIVEYRLKDPVVKTAMGL